MAWHLCQYYSANATSKYSCSITMKQCLLTCLFSTWLILDQGTSFWCFWVLMITTIIAKYCSMRFKECSPCWSFIWCRWIMAAAKEQQQTKKAISGVIKLYSLPFFGMLVWKADTVACDLTVHFIVDWASWMMPLVAVTRCWSQSKSSGSCPIGMHNIRSSTQQVTWTNLISMTAGNIISTSVSWSRPGLFVATLFVMHDVSLTPT